MKPHEADIAVVTELRKWAGNVIPHISVDTIVQLSGVSPRQTINALKRLQREGLVQPVGSAQERWRYVGPRVPLVRARYDEARGKW